MKKTKKLLRWACEFLIFTLVMGFIVSQFMGTTFAVMSSGDPNIVITIDQNGHISQTGNLFGDELWYPDNNGRDGVIRIYNNYKSTKLTSLGVDITLNSYRDGYNESEVYQSFLNHMKLSIKKGSWLEFGDSYIIHDMPLAEFKNGITLDINNQVNISASKPLDLKYTLYMDEEAGNELQNLDANVAFLIKTPIDTTGDNNNPGNEDPSDPGPTVPVSNPTNTEEKQLLIEEPLIKIPDIDGHWAHDCIVALLDKGIIQGDEKGRIRPDDPITRAESAVLVAKALNLQPNDSKTQKYKDTVSQWALGYVNITTDKIIFKGYPNGQFKPNNNITREEMMTVLTRAFKLKLDDQSLQLPFEDKAKIGAWAEESVKAGFEDQVITGYPDNTYRPQDKITRAETFTIICKLLGYHETHLKKIP